MSRPFCPHKTEEENAEIDLSLAVLDSLLPAERKLTFSEIGEFVGLDPSIIFDIQKRALEKIRAQIGFSGRRRFSFPAPPEFFRVFPSQTQEKT